MIRLDILRATGVNESELLHAEAYFDQPTQRTIATAIPQLLHRLERMAACHHYHQASGSVAGQERTNLLDEIVAELDRARHHVLDADHQAARSTDEQEMLDHVFGRQLREALALALHERNQRLPLLVSHEQERAKEAHQQIALTKVRVKEALVTDSHERHVGHRCHTRRHCRVDDFGGRPQLRRRLDTRVPSTREVSHCFDLHTQPLAQRQVAPRHQRWIPTMSVPTT